eukprot:TRINITY_DN43237_c0_g1_i1.p1 TRINITY_DN43237_c0_g1~~TRINITY_DN43237_c0_g1_i1.p1  ORF type:complete len:405 (+),score=59.11 TRINITY_DN43237_c0_g1_i1:94-1308(+)
MGAGPSEARSGTQDAAGPTAVHTSAEDRTVVLSSASTGSRPLGCAVGWAHTVVLSARGALLCRGTNRVGQLGVGDCTPRPAFVTVRLLEPAAAVSCGLNFSVAASRGGAAVYSWGWAHEGRLGHCCGAALPAEVLRLPLDPVVLLEAGGGFAIAVTRSDLAYGWGTNWSNVLALGAEVPIQWAPTRIAALSGRGIRRLACGVAFAVAETRSGGLLVWGVLPGSRQRSESPRQLRAGPGGIAFPLRSLAAGSAAAAADAAGQLWCLWHGESELARAGLPAAACVVRVACTGRVQPKCPEYVVALTVEGFLWDCTPAFCRRITAGRPGQGLLPCGGSCAKHIALIADPSCGLRRCRLLLLAAERRGMIPGGEMRRVALTPFLVDEDWIFEPRPGDAGTREEAVCSP